MPLYLTLQYVFRCLILFNQSSWCGVLGQFGRAQDPRLDMDSKKKMQVFFLFFFPSHRFFPPLSWLLFKLDTHARNGQ